MWEHVQNKVKVAKYILILVNISNVNTSDRNKNSLNIHRILRRQEQTVCVYLNYMYPTGSISEIFHLLVFAHCYVEPCTRYKSFQQVTHSSEIGKINLFL